MQPTARRAPSLLTRACCAAVIAAAMAVPAFAADAGGDKNLPVPDQIRDLLAEGVRQYRIGRYGESATTFRKAVELGPENKLAYDFYLAAGEPLLMAMEAKAELDDVLKDIRRRANIYRTELRHDARYIELMISKLTAGEEERVAAQYELVSIGPFAVPYLAAKIGDNRQDATRVAARIVLTRMGYRAVLPLCAALDSADQALVRTTASVLADIGDPRALPQLKRIATGDYEATTKQVAENAIAEIAKRSASDASAEPAALFLSEALRYFRGGDQVRDEVVANEALVWRWVKEADGGPVKQLTSVVVPRYAWNELVAEELIHTGLRYYPNYGAFHPLLAADLAAEVVEADARLKASKEATLPPSGPDEATDAIAERVQALAAGYDRVRMFGPERLYRAVDIAVRNERYDVSAAIMRLLQDRSLAQAVKYLPGSGFPLEKAGTPLVAALDHQDKLTTYEAAITLAWLDPNLAYTNRDKVVGKLAQAVGESGLRVVLVVDPDFRARNQARALLQARGYVVTTAADGHAALQRLRQTPVIDAIVIAADLVPTLKGEHGEDINVPEQTAPTLVDFLKQGSTEKLPIFISLPEHPELAAKSKALFAEKKVGFAEKPFKGEVLAGAIDLALKDAQAPNANRDLAEDIALRAAIALQKPDPERTALDLSQAAEALVQTLDNRRDELRIEACKALASIALHANGAAAKALGAKVVSLYNVQNAELKPATRAAFILAIGALAPTDPAAVEIFKAALKHEDATVAAAAHAAVGHAEASPDELITDYQVRQRLDVRAQGAAKAP
jgi:CheY-like chemotaxis protein